jgi:phenylalanyl-tRNA synthetase beta chain
MELDADALPPAGVPVGPRISAFPPVYIDLAFVGPRDVPAAEVESGIRSAAGDLLEDVRLFDAYEGSSVEQGMRSLAYRLTLRAPDRTLTSADTQRVVTQVEMHLLQRGLSIRSSSGG